jgi:prepilin signal peptidase PulO-like enzyme (type II secretory pathway)
MEIMAIALIFFLGAVFGSFLNVLIYRFNSGFSLGGRSMCLSCGKSLGWSELVPLVSYLILKGRCRKCSSPISIQYPLVELVTGLCFVGIYEKVFNGPFYMPHLFIEALIFALIWCTLVVIAGYDIRHKIIPDPLVLAFILFSLAHLVLFYGTALFSMPNLLYELLAGPLIAAPFALLWLASSGRWIGFGDAKLALGIGWLLGLSAGTSAILLGFWTGAFLSILLLIISKLPEKHFIHRMKLVPKGITGKTEIPFAPFLILGTALVFFFNLSVIAF